MEAPAPEPPHDYAQECKDGKDGACAKACLEVDPSHCNEEIYKRLKEPTKEPEVLLKLLEHTCAQDNKNMCAELGGMSLGRDKKRAIWAYKQYCTGSDAGPDDCLSARQKWIDEAEVLRPKCDSGDAGACVDLGEVYWAADNGDDTVEAFAKACEIRGLDTYEITPEQMREICGTDMTFRPHYDHPGPRGRCGEEIVYFMPRGNARDYFNSHPYMSPGSSTKALEAPPRKKSGGSSKLRLDPIKQKLDEYSMEELTKKLEEMHDELEYCASASPEIHSRIAIWGSVAIDKFGAPAFIHVQQWREKGGYAPREAWRQFHGCLRSVFSTHTYPKPLGNHGVRVFIPMTMNPNAPVIEPPKMN
jgi:hypothetical protein